MARKLIPDDKKWAAVLRVLQHGSRPVDEARRLSVTPKAIQKWTTAYLKAHPDADKRVKHAPPPPPPAAPDPAPQPVPKPAEAAEPPKPAVGELDKAAVAEAVAADGAVGTTLPTTTPGRPAAPAALVPISLSTEAEDLAVVEGAGNQVMGLACRVMIFAFEMKAGVTVQMTRRLQELFVLTDIEKSMLKPASRHLAHKIRELIGSDEKVAFGVAGSTVATGLWDRARVIGEAIAEAASKLPQKPGPEKK